MKKDFFYLKSTRALEFHKVMSLVAEKAVSPSTRAKMEELLPVYDASCVHTLLKQTEEARLLITYKPAFPMEIMEDKMLFSLDKAQKEISLSADEVMDTAKLLRVAMRLKQYYEDKKFDTSSLDLFFENLYINKKLLEEIDRTFLPSGAVSDDASPELARIRRSIIRAGQGIKEELEKYIKSPSVSSHLQEPIVTIRSNRYVIPVKADNRGDINGLLHDTSNTGNTLFIEPLFVIEQNNKIKKLELEEENEILRILANLTQSIAVVATELRRSFHTVLSLDYIIAKAKYAYENDCCTPVISHRKSVRFKNARHPLIDKKVMVPLDIEMDQKRDTIIVTGPNTGGKTVFLKTLGLLCLMTKAGVPVPAENAEVFVFRRIFADIGDEQSIEQSLSTFSSHMRNIKNIIASCGKDDMVLFDEIGGGTDPPEGAALAVSVIQKIRDQHTFVAATTHYGELKTYALTTPGVQNASFAFDLVQLAPTYQLQLGIPGKSYAFEISKRLGLPEQVIADAKARIDGEQQNVEQVIDALNEQRNTYVERLSQMKNRERELIEQKASLEKERKRLFQNSENRIATAEQKARGIVEGARRQAEMLQSELKKLREQMDKAQYQTLKSGIKKAAGKLEFSESHTAKQEGNRTPPLSEPPKVGQKVYVPKLNRNAVVESIVGSQVFVNMDHMRIKVKAEDLCMPMPEQEKKTAVQFKRAEFNRTVKTELDIRGMNVLDAVEEIDRFLDGAVLAKLPSVTIIHGKGTGVLRSGVHAHLKTHRLVRTFRLGAFGQGDSGVTIVDLK